MDKSPSEKWDTFLQSHQAMAYKDDQVLLFQGESPQFVYVIKQGIVKVYDISDKGYEQLIDFHTRGETFPMPWIMGSAPTSLYYYQTVTACEIYRLSKEEYVNFLKSDEAILFSELEQYARKEIDQTARLAAVLHSKASDKLINTLQYLIQTHGIFLGHNLVKINLILTHQDFANLTGLRRETAAVELNKLKDKGIIHYRPHALYHVDLRLLNNVLNNQYTVANGRFIKSYLTDESPEYH
jgi:CRP/FNR family cyclic AMP-dependent transcriptional regulator